MNSKRILSGMILLTVAAVALAAGIAWANLAQAASGEKQREAPAKKPKVVYPTRTELDFEGAQIEGELRNPGEFYFQHRHEEKFDSLVKPRSQFHREMLRDAMLSK
jgi:hypothetical protein